MDKRTFELKKNYAKENLPRSIFISLNNGIVCAVKSAAAKKLFIYSKKCASMKLKRKKNRQQRGTKTDIKYHFSKNMPSTKLFTEVIVCTKHRKYISFCAKIGKSLDSLFI